MAGDALQPAAVRYGHRGLCPGREESRDRDCKGIIGLIGTVLGERAISILHAQAELDNAPDAGNVYLLVDKCSPGIIRAAVGQLAGLSVVCGRPVVMPLIE